MRLMLILAGAVLLICVGFVIVLIARSVEGDESERGFRRGPGAGAAPSDPARQAAPAAPRPGPDKPAAPATKDN